MTMLTQAATATKIVRVKNAAELNTALEYLAPGAAAAVVKDRTPVATRDALIDELKALRPLTVLDNVQPDPMVADIEAMAESVRAAAPGVLVAIGGGSTIDSAKGLAAVLSNGGTLTEYLGAGATRKLERREVKLVAIPTTAGTGSEVTKVGVYTAPGGRKYTLGNPLLQPDMAVHAPWLTHGLPPAITAATGIDALSHALEVLWNKNITPLAERLAVDAAIQILKHIETAYESAHNGGVAGRLEMLEGATHAGAAFTLTGTAMVHALSFILGEEWHVPHGVACAFTLEDALSHHAGEPAVRQRMKAVAAGVGSRPADPIVWMHAKLVDLKRRLGLPFRFADLDVQLEDRELPRLFARALDDPKMKNTLVPLDKEGMLRILRGKL